MKCAVKNCTNSKDTNKDLFLFCLPKNGPLREKWVEFCGQSVSSTARVCEDHFRKEDLIGKVQCDLGIQRRVLLRRNACPSIHKRVGEEIAEPSQEELEEQERLRLVEFNLQLAKRIQKSQALSPQVYSPKRKAAKELVDDDVLDSKTQIHTLKSELKKLQNKYDQLTNYLHVKEEIFESTLRNREATLIKTENRYQTMVSRLKEVFTKGQIEKLQLGETGQSWTREEIMISKTLYSASPKCYKLLRKRKYPLPAIQTLQNWGQIDSPPAEINIDPRNESDEINI